MAKFIKRSKIVFLTCTPCAWQEKHHLAVFAKGQTWMHMSMLGKKLPPRLTSWALLDATQFWIVKLMASLLDCGHDKSDRGASGGQLALSTSASRLSGGFSGLWSHSGSWGLLYFTSLCAFFCANGSFRLSQDGITCSWTLPPYWTLHQGIAFSP